MEKRNVKLVLIKKGLKYYRCLLNDRHNAKLIISDETEKLETGKPYDLLVVDKSVSSKYGVDIIFDLVGEAKADEIVSFKHPIFNTEIVDKCKHLGGKFDHEERAWIFSSIVSSEVEELDFIYNSSPVAIEITAKKQLYGFKDPVTFYGYDVCKAFSRDGGARLGDGIAHISGEYGSGGSKNNWQTHVMKDCTFRLKIPSELLKLKKAQANDPDNENWEIKTLE